MHVSKTKKGKIMLPAALYLEFLFTAAQREVNTIVPAWNAYNCFVKQFWCSNSTANT